MAINFLNNISLNKNQLEQARIENLATDPGSGVSGQIYFNTASNVLKIYNGTIWTEVGGGVITVDTGDSTFINLADSGTTADPILTASLSATGTTDNTTFLRGDNTWSLISAIPGTYTWTLAGNTGASQLINSGNTASILGTGVITTAASATDTITITHSNVTRTNTTSSASPAFGATFTAVDSVTSSAQGHITAVNLKTVTLPANPNTTYTLPVAAGAANTAVINLTAGGSGSGVASSVTFSGTANEIEVTETVGNNGTITIGLPNNVTVTGALTVSGAAQSSFGGQVTIPTTPIASTDAASKAYVDASNVGQSVFQGGYNAATNTPDLDVAPSALIKKGWFWAVTNTGVFFTETVQPGDLLYANVDNPGATFANWVVVQSGQDIAGEGATDGATVKGVAGFNSAHFNVTANGWVSSDIYTGGSNLGIVPSGGEAGTLLNGAGSWTAAYSLPEATATVRGGIELFSNTDQAVAANSISSTAGRTYGSQLNSDGQLVVNVPWTNTTYSMMTSTALGLGKLFSDTVQTIGANTVSATASRTYGVQKNASDQLVVNVPWVNTQAVSSVSPSSANGLLGMSVTPTTGAVVVGLNINGLAAISTLDDADTLAIYDGGINKKVSLLQLENHIGAAKSKRFILNTTTANVSQQVSPPGGTIGWVIAVGTALGVSTALDCAVEIIQTSNGATVYAEVTRSGTDVTINFSTPVSQGAYQAIVTRIY
jgi:hypothetical protein